VRKKSGILNSVQGFLPEDKEQTDMSEERDKMDQNTIDEDTIDEDTIEILDHKDKSQKEADKAFGSASSETESTEDPMDKEYEKVCFICRRPESKTGKMVRMPGNMDICPDCLQKAFNSLSGSNLSDYEQILKNYPGMGMNIINLNELGMNSPEVPGRQRLKKKKKEESPVPFDRKQIPAPHQIKAQLDEYVVGQEKAKKAISVAVYNHYKRISADLSDGIEIEKSNMLLLGPTGCGKTYLVKTLARLLNVPLAIADATSLTEAGYIGDDIESVISKLLAAADNDVERAEHGIVYIDEIDKIAKKKNSTTRDVSGESVQQELLKMLEGAEVEVPVGSNSKNAMVPMTTINTTNILFICGGAFPDLEEIVRKRLNQKAGIGYQAQVRETRKSGENLLGQATTEDLRQFGMIPEFLGRLPVLVALEPLNQEYMLRILKEPRNAITRQYQKLFAMDEVKLEFEDEALEYIAEEAMKKETGARALRSIIEEFMMDIMYEIPKDDNIGSVTITKAYLTHTGGPRITLRGMEQIQG
jgi:ATP-dependent Clp protease ATP-binding subunit ClpX